MKDKFLKPRLTFFQRLKELRAKFRKVDEEYFEELESSLIMSDISYELTLKIIEETKHQVKLNNIKDVEAINDILIQVMKEYYGDSNSKLKLNEGINVILVCGVNGVGKTTSIAKLTHLFKKKKTLLVAADTFRAGAVDQIEVWANKLKVDLVKGKENADPSSVLYDGLNKAKNENYELVIVDTAGRVQTSINLMNELSKMKRIINKVLGLDNVEVLQVIDATTGQNGILQAKSFLNASDVTGIILTKMDSTSKGGIILSIKEQLNIPVKLICFGEDVEDIDYFDIDEYLNNIFKDKE